jgi:IS30 family transposase
MPKHYKHLTSYDRCQIYTLKQSGKSQAAISLILNVNQSTISRELRRNTGLRGYRFKQAHALATQRGSARGCGARVLVPALIAKIEDLLRQKQWSPQQISGRLKLQSGTKVSTETIYRHVWRDKKLGGTLYVNLRCSGKKYNKRKGLNSGRGMIPDRIDITQRPQIVADKTRLGDWELDSIIGAHHKGAITSMVERVSKLVRLALLATPSSAATKDAIIAKLSPLKAHVHTLTSDNGKEFAAHKIISSALESEFYFATPYHSWERGLNENTNGLVRQYFPKRLNFNTLTHSDVKKVEDLLNNRPRKTLNYLTPIEVFSQITQTKNYALLM